MENESGRKWDGGRGGEHSPGAGCRSGLASRRRRAAGRGKVGRHRCSLLPLATNAGHHRCPAPPTGIWVTTQSNCKKTQSLSQTMILDKQGRGRGLQAHDIDIGCRRTIDITGLGKRHWLLGCLIDCGESPLVIYIFFTLLHSPIKQMWYCQSSFALE